MGMGRTRARSRVGWPDNLYPNKGGFKYRHPFTKKETRLGNDRTAAFTAAKKLNALLAAGNDLVSRVMGTSKKVKEAIKVFRTDDMPGRKWAPKTADTYGGILKRIETGLGHRDLETLTVKDCAEFIRAVTESERGRQQFRLVLSWVLACAVEEGWIDSNPALATRRFSHKRKRRRLTVEDYEAIHAQAPAWLQNAMDLSLLTLLRREDIVSLQFADHRDGRLWVMPGKTEWSTGVRLKIQVDAELAALLARARDNVVSPFIIHRLPEKARPKEKRAKSRTHHTQVLPEQLTREFQEARDVAGLGKTTPEGTPPTFHEIRSLGGAMLREVGWTKAQVKDLMTHASEAMTEVYLDGHEQPWTEVTTGIQLPNRVTIG